MSAQHPTPWKVAFWTDLDGEQKYDDDEPIQDANGNAVIKTDSGVYPPDRETVAEIICAVNLHQTLLRIVADLRPLAEAEFSRLKDIADSMEKKYPGTTDHLRKVLQEMGASIDAARAVTGMDKEAGDGQA